MNNSIKKVKGFLLRFSYYTIAFIFVLIIILLQPENSRFGCARRAGNEIFSYVISQFGNSKNSYNADPTPDNYKYDRQILIAVFNFIDEAKDILNIYDTESDIGKIRAAEDEYTRLIDKAITLSYEINDEYLDYIHPECRKMFRNHLITGHHILIYNTKEKKLGLLLINDWFEWVDNNREILNQKQ